MSKENQLDYMTQPLSGFRDTLAEQMIPRQEMIDTIRRVYERYGFTPLDTPAIERQEVLLGKYGEEGEKLVYKFQDHGERPVALRYDLTVPLARVIADRENDINLPYKRYQIGKVWRGERPQSGRYREFMQFDADIVGSSSATTDAEIVAMMADTMNELGVNATVRVNNRRLLDALAERCGIESESEFRSLLGTIDKYEKIGHEVVIDEITNKFNDNVGEIVSRYLSITGENDDERLSELESWLETSEAAQEGISNLRSVMRILREAGYEEAQVKIDPTIARGLDYYTGIVYETTLSDNPEIGSVCSGGRYDNLIGQLGGPDLPAVGTSVGVDRLFTALEQMGNVEGRKSTSKLLITSFNETDAPQYFKLATRLRREGIAVEIYPDNEVGIGKQVRYADKQGIPHVAFLGSEEIEKDSVSVKNMETGEQKSITIDELIKFLKEH